jgi:hypothetical protein
VPSATKAVTIRVDVLSTNAATARRAGSATSRIGLASPAGFDNGARGRFNAWFFTALDRSLAHIASRHKQMAFGDLGRGDVVELVRAWAPTLSSSRPVLGWS